ncbi:hypothetical protein fugu_003298 [Takifugu bimaculatus]|uniref:Major facilitator superfamily (MFS) profile domain-containing protein n=1 Tax=Takifugu bimaculatus TaxID=433685 RepID=A0A4Z2BG76_9TELE|nr:hypothetical protein fugu_003298 [Takifugu bimaculatus]
MVAPPSPGSRLQHMDYDAKILPRTGGYGRYNRLVVVCSWFPTFAVTLNLISDVFYTRIPDSYHCQPDPRLLPSALLLSNVTSQRYLNLTIPWVNGTGLSHCQLFKYPSNVSDFTGNVPKEVVSCTKGWVFAHEAGLQSNFVTEWNLVCNDYWKIPLQHICFMSGWIMGYILLGTLSDCYYRPREGTVSSCYYCEDVGEEPFVLGTDCRGCSPSVTMLISDLTVGGALFLSGSGQLLASLDPPAVLPVSLSHTGSRWRSSESCKRRTERRLELCDPLHRLMASMVGGFFSIFAEVCLPAVAALCRDWPVLQAVATLPLLQLLSCWCCASMFPESPRWLLATNQMSLAKRSLQDVTVRNGVCLQDDMYPGETLLAQIDSASEERQPKFFTVLELRRTRVIWKNCLILSFTLFIGTGIQYCFTRNLHTYSTNFYFAYFVRVITGALACVFICLSVNRYGRRGMLLLSAIVTGLSSLLLLALTQYLYGAMVLVLSVVGLLFSQALAMLSVFFASEVMPTVLRGGCLGLVLAAGCVGMAASSLMELQNNGGYFLHQVIFASFAVLSVLCILLLPESKRKSLPDSVAEGENQRRPPLFSARPHRDSLPLLYTTGASVGVQPR